MAEKKNKKCSIWYCEKRHYAHGYCKAHLTAFQRYGNPYGKHPERQQRIEAEILKARLISIRILEVVEQTKINLPTEFVEPASLSGTHLRETTNYCLFCQQIDNKHLSLCVYNLAKSLLKNTSGCEPKKE